MNHDLTLFNILYVLHQHFYELNEELRLILIHMLSQSLANVETSIGNIHWAHVATSGRHLPLCQRWPNVGTNGRH